MELPSLTTQLLSAPTRPARQHGTWHMREAEDILEMAARENDEPAIVYAAS